jgi:exonuclease V gamma subunit
MTFYFSNDFEKLKNNFLDIIYKDKNKNNDLFNIDYIIVQNYNLKKYLQLEISKKYNIFCGFNFEYLENGIIKLLFNLIKENFKEEDFNDVVFLNNSENLIYLQFLITKIIIENDELKEVLKNIYNNLNIEQFKNKSSKYVFFWNISQNLVYYLREIQYHIPEIVNYWKEDKNYFNIEGKKHSSKLSDKNNGILIIENLYRLLYKEILKYFDKNKFEEKFILFCDFFYQIISKSTKKEILDQNRKNVYIFGFSQMPRFYFQVLSYLSNYYNINYFFFDLVHDYFAKFYNNSEENDLLNFENIIEKYFINNVKNLGNLYYYFTLKKDENFFIEEIKDETPKQIKNLNLLERLKYLFKYYYKIKEIPYLLKKEKQDESFQIIACPSKLREIETVYNSIVYNLLNDKELKLNEIAILVTDIDQYVYEIRNVFDSYGYINYNIVDLKAESESYLYKALLSFFDLIDSEYNREKVLNFISNPLVVRKFDLNQFEFETICNIIDRLGIYYSYDINDKKDFSEFKDSNLFTWSYGLKRIRAGYIFGNFDRYDYENLEDSYFKTYLPYSDFYLKDLNNLDKVNNFLENLFSILLDIKKLDNICKNIDNETKEDCYIEWQKILNRFIDDFIYIDEDDNVEISYKIRFLEIVDNLKRLSLFAENQLSFDLVKLYIKEIISNIDFKKGSYLSDGVVISKIIPMRPIPFKIIYIVGMNEDLYPKNEILNDFDLRKYDKNYISKYDFDNYNILEILFLTSKKLYFTYTSKDLEKDKLIYPSSVIKDFVSIINDFILDNFKIIEVPISIEDFFLYKSEDLMQYDDITDVFKLTLNEKIKNINKIKNIIKDTSYKDNKKVLNFELLNNNKLIYFNEFCDYIINPKKFLIKKIFDINFDVSENIFEVGNEPFFEEKYEFNNILKDLFNKFLYLVFSQRLSYNEILNKIESLKNFYKNKFEIDSYLNKKPEYFYREFINEKLDKAIKFFKEDVQDIFKIFESFIEQNKKENKDKNESNELDYIYYEKIVFDFIKEDNIKSFEPYKIDEFYIKGEIENLVRKNNILISFDYFYDKKDDDYLIKNILRKILGFYVYILKNKDLKENNFVFDYCIFNNDSLNIFSFDCEIFNILGNLLNDMNNDIKDGKIYNFDFDIFYKIKDNKENSLDIKQLFDKYKDQLKNYNYKSFNTQFKINYEDIFLKNHYLISYEDFEKRCSFIDKIKNKIEKIKFKN